MARLDDDEFFVILEQELENTEDAANSAQRILNQVTRHYTLDGNMVRATASIGIALFPDDGVRSEDLMRHADTAMYRAKEQGRNTYRFYKSEMTEQVYLHLEIRNNLNNALTSGEFVMHYQPIIGLASRQMLGVEVLLRWNREDGIKMSPDEFIPLTEQNGLIVHIGEWVLRTVCDQQSKWQQLKRDISVSVNISARGSQS